MSEHEPRPPRTTYHSEVERLLDRQGKTYADIARDIRLKSFGEKRPGEMLRECASYDSKLIGYDYGFSRALIAKLLTSGDEKTYKKLLRLSRRDRQNQRAKTVSVAESPVRDERELYAINPEDASQLLGLTEEYLMRLEQGKRKNSPKRERRIVNAVRQEGESRIRQILEQIATPPTTIREIVSWIALRKKVYGYGDHLHQLSNRLPGIGRELLQYIIKGKDMPPLPVIKRILASGEIELTEELTQDWSHQFALFERSRSPTDIGRAFQTICAEQYESRRAFEKIHGSSLKKSLRRIQCGQTCELKSIHKALDQLGVQKDSPRWLWVESLYAARTIPSALEWWYAQMESCRLPVDWSYRQLPGLTREELPPIELSPSERERRRQEERRKRIEPLLKRAKKIDQRTFDNAPDRIADIFYDAIQRRCTDHEKLIRDTLTAERLIQWAFGYNLTIASPYYDTLRRFIEDAIKTGTFCEDIQIQLQQKIDAIAARDQEMALADNAPGIHRAKIKTGRKTKGPNNY